MTITGSLSALLPAMLVAEGLRPVLLDITSDLRDGWACLTRGLGAAVNFGPLPLRIARDGVLVAEIVEIEQRGEDWWGRVEMRGENEAAKTRDRFDDAMLGMHVSRVSVRPGGVNVERVEPLTVSIRATKQKARTFEPAWIKQKPEPRGPNRRERRAAQARARRAR